MHVRSVSSNDPFNTSEKFKEGLIVYLGVTKVLAPFKVREILFNNKIQLHPFVEIQLIEKYWKGLVEQDQNLCHLLKLFSERFSKLSYEELCEYYHKLVKDEQ